MSILSFSLLHSKDLFFYAINPCAIALSIAASFLAKTSGDIAAILSRVNCFGALLVGFALLPTRGVATFFAC